MTGTDFIKAQCHAQRAAECLLVAYWTECQAGSDAAKYHADDAVAALRQLAAAMGFTVAPAAPE